MDDTISNAFVAHLSPINWLSFPSGIHSKLDYIKDTLKADAINLGVIQQSAGKTLLGSDVTNFNELHKQFGSMEDFENLRSAVHKKGFVIIDIYFNRSYKFNL